ncbi:hypothetical protein [Neorhodopirellula lusitana]|uniref:hypothetical protein n=1 Tax=Neorhodopirellula lusitana TaxID=445327 RepID=UPI00384A7CCA
MTVKQVLAKNFEIDAKVVERWGRFSKASSVSDKFKIARNIATEAEKQRKKLTRAGCESPEQVVNSEIAKLVGKDEARRFLAIKRLPDLDFTEAAKRHPDGRREISFTHILILTRLIKTDDRSPKKDLKVIEVFKACCEHGWSCRKLAAEVSKTLSSPPRSSVWTKKIRVECNTLATSLEGSPAVFKPESIDRIKTANAETALKEMKQLAKDLARLEELIKQCLPKLTKAKKKLDERISNDKKKSKGSQ